MKQIEITGERFHPEVGGKSAIEHYSRYSFTLDYISGKRILDVACGEGYGSNFLSHFANKVYGVDKNLDTINAARVKYTKENLEFICASIDNLPFENYFFDVIVCFETIEHVIDHMKALEELKRLLNPTGVLIISTPEKNIYNKNNLDLLSKFHEKELTRSEFGTLLFQYFDHVNFYLQDFIFASIIYNEEEKNSLNNLNISESEILNWTKPEGEFIIAIASNRYIGRKSGVQFFNNPNYRSIEHEFLFKFKQMKLLNGFRYRLINFLFYPLDLIKKITKG
jgi:2-polyprenyl-3-methyl-5-hydroxy-6-metoxy-1,4-benzoquinol methylase